MVQCLVGVGSNLGDSRSILDLAVERLDRQLNVLAASGWHTYPSIGPAADGTSDQPDFLNGVVVVDSALSAQETVNVLHEIEKMAGRSRVLRWSSRTLDVDLLIYGDEIVCSDTLQVPHPRMMSRRFVLEPACEVAPDVVHPIMGWSMQRLLDHLCDAEPYFVTVGSDFERTKRIARQLAHETNGTFHSLDRLALPSSSSDRIVQSAEEKLTILANEIRSTSSGPWFADFWIGEFDVLSKSRAYDPLWNPKLVLVTEAVQSKFAMGLAKRIERVNARLRVPMIYLSSNENEAWQDALGAVQGMQ